MANPAAGYPLVIDSDAASTNTPAVSIYIYGAWTQMRLHNDSDAPGAWQPFQSSFNRTLDGGVGVHTVTAELSNGSQAATTSDTIYLAQDTTPDLSGLPDSHSFTYSMADSAMSVNTLTLSPTDADTGTPLTWSITSQGASWFTVTPTAGTSPASSTITPTHFDASHAGAYTGSVTVTVTSPGGTINDPTRSS